MTEIERIEDQLKRAFEGEAWHGPSVQEVLAGVTAEQAARKPLAHAHTIWEIVLHLAAWDAVVRRRLEGERLDEPDEGDWPSIEDTSAPAWADTLDRLKNNHTQLRHSLSRLDDSLLDQPVGSGKSSAYATIQGSIQHYLYHAGQIALLKKA
ncbi:MAG: DinB family protein [Pyrinomonadaceae bacterium]